MPHRVEEDQDLMHALTWDDPEGIALALAAKFPDVDPLTVRFTDLHRWITELADFADDPKASSEGKLESIQMAWREEWEENG
jgi:FeS assembly protein IscX